MRFFAISTDNKRKHRYHIQSGTKNYNTRLQKCLNFEIESAENSAVRENDSAPLSQSRVPVPRPDNSHPSTGRENVNNEVTLQNDSTSTSSKHESRGFMSNGNSNRGKVLRKG